MSQLPLFASAPRVYLKINGQRLAVAIGINFSFNIDIQPVYAIGSYAPISLEPTYYNPVTGTIQILRMANKNVLSLTDSTSDDINAKGQKTGYLKNSEQVNTKSSNEVLGISSAGSAAADATATAAAKSAIASTVLDDHLNPDKVLVSSLFDMEIWMKYPTVDGSGNTSISNGTSDCKWFEISGCRITSRNVNMTMGQIVNEPISFQGLLVNPTELDGFSLDNVIKDK